MKTGYEGYCRGATELTALCCADSELKLSVYDFLADLFNKDGAEGFLRNPSAKCRAFGYKAGNSGRANRHKKFEADHGRPDDGRGAIDACVASMVEDNSALRSLYQSLDTVTFATRFHELVIPQIEDGFSAEGYDATTIQMFGNALDELLKAEKLQEENGFQDFAKTLVAGLIYGPGEAEVLGKENVEPTKEYLRSEHGVDAKKHGRVAFSGIRITQIFDLHMGRVGKSMDMGDAAVMLIGKSDNPKKYLNRLRKLYAEAGPNEKETIDSLMDMIQTAATKPVVFDIDDKFKQTSRCHGAIVEGVDEQGNGCYFYYDLGSEYKTRVYVPEGVKIGRKYEVLEAFAADRIKPGECLVLGYPDNPNVTIAYGSAMLKISFVVK